MEESRILDSGEVSKEKTIWLPKKVFGFVEKLRVGDKGSLDMAATVYSERLEDESDVIKTIKIKSLTPTRNERMI